jgi:hypothetical protein
MAGLSGSLCAGEKALRSDISFDGISKRTEEIRGLSFKNPVAFERLSKEGLVALLKRELARQYTREDWRNIEASLQLLGAIPPEMELEKFFEDLLGEQVGGLYDPRSKKMYVVGDLPLSVGLVQVILEHELTHALTDQHFNLLSLPIEETANDDRALAATAVVEGDATLSMASYAKDLGLGGLVSTVVVSLFMNQEVFSVAPAYLQASTLFPYLGGEVFLIELMTHYRMHQGELEKLDNPVDDPLSNWDVVNHLYAHPPESTEQVLHPEKYAASPDSPTPVVVTEKDLAALGDGWTKVRENSLGELLLKTLLLEKISPLDAEEAAEGWDGDRYALARSPAGHTALLWLSAWDSEKDAREFKTAMQEYQKAGGLGEGALAFLERPVNTEVGLKIVSDPNSGRMVKEEPRP